MELHHSKHHQTYVNGLNSALESIGEADAKGDATKAATIAPLLNFHGGGHLNHSLFWENLAPANKDGGGEPEGELKVRLNPKTGRRCRPHAQLPTSKERTCTNNPRIRRKPSTVTSAPSPPFRSRPTPRSPVSRAAAGHGWPKIRRAVLCPWSPARTRILSPAT